MQLSLIDDVQKLIAKRLVALNSKKRPIKCVACYLDATTEVLLETDGIIVRQTYCDECLAREGYQITT